MESCGLLVGRTLDRQVLVGRFAFCANLATDPDGFILAPKDHLRIVAETKAPEAVVGVFHSHRGPADPSAADVYHMKLYDFVWLIIGNTAAASMSDLDCRAYRLDAGGRVLEVRIVRAEGPAGVSSPPQ